MLLRDEHSRLNIEMRDEYNEDLINGTMYNWVFCANRIVFKAPTYTIIYILHLMDGTSMWIRHWILQNRCFNYRVLTNDFKGQARCEAKLIVTSGTENLVSSLSKKVPLYKRERRLPSSLLAVPGGPINRMCSPLRAAKSIKRTSVSLSMSPTFKIKTLSDTFVSKLN